MPTGFDVDTIIPENISTTSADFGAEMVDFDETTHDAARVYFEIDTDNTFPSPTQLDSSVDVGLFTQNSQVFNRGDGLMPDTNYYVRAQAENVVYSDSTLFSTAAQESEGFIIDVSNNDLDNAITSELAVTPMSNYDESTYNLLKHPDAVSNFWSLDQATQNFWNNGSFSGSSTEGVWSRDLDFAGASQLVFDVKDSLPIGDYNNTLYTTVSDSTDWVNSVAFGDGFMAVGSYDNNVYVYDTSDFTLTTTLTDSTDRVYSVAFDDGFLAVGSGDSQTYVYDTNNFSLQQTLTDSTVTVYSVAFSGNGFLAVGSGDNNVYVYDTNNFSLQQTLTNSTDTVYAVAFGNGFLATGSQDNTSYVYDTSDFTLTTTLTDATSRVYSVAFGEGFLATGSYDNNVYVYDTNNFSLQQTLTDSTDYVYSVAFSGNGFLAATGQDSTSYVYDTSDFTITTTLTDTTSRVYSVAFGEGFLATGGGDITSYIYEGVTVSEPTSVNIGNQNIFEESIGSDSFVEKSVDISSFDSVENLELLISRDIGSSVYTGSLGVGATGNGNSFIISNPDSNFKVEFSDIRLQ